MKRNAIVSGLLVVFAASWVLSVAMADDKPKYTIKEVMKLHSKDKLHTKYLDGKASKEEKEKLIEAYEAMGKNKPTKNAEKEKEWKAKADALVKALKDDDKAAFKKAVDCGGCHKEFQKK